MRVVVISANGLVSELLVDALKIHSEDTFCFDGVEAIPDDFNWENCVAVLDADPMLNVPSDIFHALAKAKHERFVVMMSKQLEPAEYFYLAGRVTALMPFSSTVAEIVVATRLASRGIVILPTELAARLPLPNNSAPPPRWALSDRESRVLRLLGLGFSDKRIARELELHEATARTHVRSVLKKLGVENRTMAALCANQVSTQLAAV